jgi:uncharacterized lipoprotein YddW (UPF0748 family)
MLHLNYIHHLFTASLIVISATFFGYVHIKPIPTPSPSEKKEQVPGLPLTEMRGAWLTTVVNLDWPSSRELTVDQQKQEMIILLDSLKYAGINAIFFQVRSEADAMFPSPYEPWSYWLTGEQGRSPVPFYDPLRFVISEGHARGMEVHAWLNPYRAHRNLDLYPQHETHIAKIRPDWILTFPGTSGTYVMLNPGMQEVRDFIANIVIDIVRRYDVDGIHFDDYFYPYTPPISTEDRPHFLAEPRGFDSIEDWRRDNINLMVRQVYDSIQVADPFVKFGISPFGIRKNSDAGTNGGQGYHLLFADPLAWLQAGTMDYIAPQLYWETSHPVAPYEPLLRWWAEVAAANNRHLYVGLAPYRLQGATDWPVEQIGTQIRINRTNQHPVHGKIYFRTRNITDNPKSIADSMAVDWYSKPALIPHMNWMPGDVPLPVEELTYNFYDDESLVRLYWHQEHHARRFAIYRYPEDTDPDVIFSGPNPAFLVGVTGQSSFSDATAGSGVAYLYAVTAVGRNNQQSMPRVILVH